MGQTNSPLVGGGMKPGFMYGQPPPGAMVAPPMTIIKKIEPPLFPADSVEATQPLVEPAVAPAASSHHHHHHHANAAAAAAAAKKRKITARDIAPVDPWKLYMSLRSGLLAESTWALDALNIMLYDDSTVAYFHLKHFPGLLNCLIEHYLKCLRRVFTDAGGDASTFDFGGVYRTGKKEQQQQQQKNHTIARNGTNTSTIPPLTNGFNHNHNNDNEDEEMEDEDEDNYDSDGRRYAAADKTTKTTTTTTSSTTTTTTTTTTTVLRISYTEKEMNKLRNKQANAAMQHTVKFNDSKVNNYAFIST